MNTLQLQFLMLVFAGWVNRNQQDIIEYLQEENRVLREQLGRRRLRFTDRQRRRLAAKAKAIGRNGLFEIARLVTPDTLLRWHRRLIALTWGGFSPIQVNLTECLLSDIAENAVSFSYQLINRMRFIGLKELG
jgi:hypothetical protein